MAAASPASPRMTLLQQELNEKGFADVMVILTTEARAALSPAVASAAAAGGAGLSVVSVRSDLGPFGPTHPALRDVLSCFESAYEESTEAALTSLSLRPPQAGGEVSAQFSYQVAPVQYLEKLGMVLGSVSATGLNTLQKNKKMVHDVRRIPELTLVHPHRMALVQPTAGITWGIDRLNIPFIWKQGLDGDGATIGHLGTG